MRAWVSLLAGCTGGFILVGIPLAAGVCLAALFAANVWGARR